MWGPRKKVSNTVGVGDVHKPKRKEEKEKCFSHFKALEMFCLWELEDCSRQGLRSLTCDPHLCFYSLHCQTLSFSYQQDFSSPQRRKLHKGKFVVLFLIAPPHTYTAHEISSKCPQMQQAYMGHFTGLLALSLTKWLELLNNLSSFNLLLFP